jgi:FtsH-binding integral membrane protein
LGAVFAFVFLEAVYFSTGTARSIGLALLSVNWLLVLGAFVVIGWLARGLAARTRSQRMQYVGLGGYVVAESIIFVPLLFVADYYAPGTIKSAALLTLVAFGGLTLVAFHSRRDFSFLRGLLKWAGVLALTAIVGAIVFRAGLGTWFSIAMIAFAGAAILHDTSNVLRNFPDDAHVAASLELFASVALMFWYVLSLISSSRRS